MTGSTTSTGHRAGHRVAGQHARRPYQHVEGRARSGPGGIGVGQARPAVTIQGIAAKGGDGHGPTQVHAAGPEPGLWQAVAALPGAGHPGEGRPDDATRQRRTTGAGGG